ncbi:transcriptional regulator [Leptospira sp. 201903071]|uniref:transcriptional regulator n=1 Tax=Leptospira ainazelensis TaxID=2810034 RepID=UPI0019652171|nr:transcriptional regulator [Leptospira ainazelensis]MBM9502913.1 transcriptional regulator [Leptospira ainazelensis]
MKEQNKRLKTILSHFGGNQTEFGRTIGKSKQTISGWLSGRFTLPEDSAIVIEMVHGFRREWILRGESPQRVPDFLRERASDNELIKRIDSKKGLRESIEVLAGLSKKEYEIAQKLLIGLTEEGTRRKA